MTKLLNTTTTNSINLNATLHGVMNAAVALVRDVLNSSRSGQFPDRQRYDMGTHDLNPDCQPRSATARQDMGHLRSI